MRQLVFLQPGKLEWQDAPEPSLQGSGEALVRPLAVATCDLDAALLRGHAPIPGPVVLGHEFVAEVTSVGEGVSQFKVGQRVVVPFAISCGTCRFCQRGLTANCSSVARNAMYGLGKTGGDWGGALADLVRVPYADAMLVPLPEGIAPATVASAGDNISDAWRSVAPYLASMPGAAVLIVGGSGGGSIGLYSVTIARALGAAQVDYVDADARRLELARGLGANAIEGRFPKRLGPYPITVDASANPAGLACALRSTEPGGTCTSVGIYYAPETPVPLLEMFTNGITFTTGRSHSRGIIPEILTMVQAGRLHPEMITTETATWEDAAEALTTFTTKLVITRPEANI